MSCVTNSKGLDGSNIVTFGITSITALSQLCLKCGRYFFLHVTCWNLPWQDLHTCSSAVKPFKYGHQRDRDKCPYYLWRCLSVLLRSGLLVYQFWSFFGQSKLSLIQSCLYTVPLKSKLPPSRETRFSSRETRLSSRKRLKNTVSTNACRSREVKTSIVKLRTRCREAS